LPPTRRAISVVWRSYGQDGDGYGIYAQRYNSTGAAQEGETAVNNYTTSNQTRRHGGDRLGRRLHRRLEKLSRGRQRYWSLRRWACSRSMIKKLLALGNKHERSWRGADPGHTISNCHLDGCGAILGSRRHLLAAILREL
jgi:hypothetical protein